MIGVLVLAASLTTAAYAGGNSKVEYTWTVADLGQGVWGGGPVPGAPPGHPPALNLTPVGDLQGWSFEDFLTAMHTGVTPSGRQLRDEYLPYKRMFGDMTDEERHAIWLFLKSLSPREYGNR